MLAQSLGQTTTGSRHFCDHQAAWKIVSQKVMEGISPSQTVRQESKSMYMLGNYFPQEKQQDKTGLKDCYQTSQSLKVWNRGSSWCLPKPQDEVPPQARRLRGSRTHPQRRETALPRAEATRALGTLCPVCDDGRVGGAGPVCC